MTRRAKDPEDMQNEVLIPPEPMPVDAEPLSDVVERRFKYLLTACTDPKDLTKALEAATQWCKVQGEVNATAGWGSALKGTMKP